MKCNIELEHKDLNRVRLDINNKTVVDTEYDSVNCNKCFEYTISYMDPVVIEVWFWPWKIKPILRLGGHMMNYGILGVQQFDHQLRFTLHPNYLERYGKNLIQSRIDSQFPDGVINQSIYDSTIGHGTDYSDLINKIKEKIR